MSIFNLKSDVNLIGGHRLEPGQKEFSKAIQNLRNKILIEFNKKFQRGVDRKMKREFSRRVVQYFNIHIKNVHDISSADIFYAGLTEMMEQYYDAIKKTENAAPILDQSIIINLNRLCREVREFLYEHVNTPGKITSDKRETKKEASLADIFEFSYLESVQEILDVLNSPRLFKSGVIPTPEELEEIGNKVLEVLKRVKAKFANTSSQTEKLEPIDIQSLKEEVAILTTDIFSNGSYLEVDENRYHLSAVEDLVARIYKYIESVTYKGEIKNIKDFLERYDVYDRNDLDFLARIFALQVSMKKFVSTNNKFNVKNMEVEHHDMETALDLAGNVIETILYNMHDREMLKSWIGDFDESLLISLDANNMTALKVVAYDILSQFEDELINIFRTHLANLSKNPDTESTLSLKDRGIDDTLRSSKDTVH